MLLSTRRLLIATLTLATLGITSLLFITDLHGLIDLIPSIPLWPSHRTFDTTYLRPPGRAHSPWIVHPSTYAFGRPLAIADPPVLNYNISGVRQPGQMVPNAVHYVFLSPDGEDGTELAYWQYLSILSALIVQKPEVLYIHSDAVPRGLWWDEIAPHVTFNRVSVPDRIFGQKVKVKAHQTDILRLLILRSLGGIYFDTDVFMIKPLDPLLYAPTTLGLQGTGKLYGLCPAVILTAPYTSFIQRFIDSYRSFWDNHWDYNSVQKPLEIAREWPDEVQLVKEETFFWPTMGMVGVYRDVEVDFDQTGQFVFHAWNKEYIRDLGPDDILGRETSFNRLVRRYMGPRDQEIWRRTAQGERAQT